MRRASWIVLVLLILGALLVGPNALWLSRSNALVINTSDQKITARIDIVGSTEQITVMVLAPGASEFLWLDLFGESTLTVEVKGTDGWKHHCQEYIENGMYRVEVTLRSPDEVTCHTDLPIFDRLLILDYLS